jgi:hypothetical protein
LECELHASHSIAFKYTCFIGSKVRMSIQIDRAHFIQQ